jgi:NAD+ kinase
MMKIAVFPNNSSQHSPAIFEKIKDFLHQNQVKVYTESPMASSFGVLPLSEINPSELDFMIAMGGDGTILHLAHKYLEHSVPILGVNLGHLGFMADVPIEDLLPSLKDLLEGKFVIENRIVLEGLSHEGKKTFAINDFVIHRAHNPSLVKFSIHLDDLYLNTFEADGVIIATPNGSTAYSLAAGGPILSPGLDGIVITPICPHTISNRPIVLTSSNSIKIEYLSDKAPPIEVIADGLQKFELHPSHIFKFHKSHLTFKLVNLTRRDYYSTLRTKLGWSGKLR